MSRKARLGWLGAIVLLLLFSVTAYADVGPKPSVVIDFRGLEGERYYATLLSTVQSTGPHSALDSSRTSRYQEGDPDYDIFLKFAAYEDGDGLYFLQFFQDCTQTHQFRWTYYPPQEFRILLYFPETDRFVVSQERCQRYAFDSYFTADVSGVGPAAGAGEAPGMTVTQPYDYTGEIIALLARVLLTIAIELGVAWAFGFREKKLLLLIALVNVATQAALNLALNIIHYRSGPMAFAFFYLPLELLVFLVEAGLYLVCFKGLGEGRPRRLRPVAYALAANAASFGLGLALARWLPQLF